MKNIKEIEPKEVFKYFEEISQIPRGSGNTAKIADYLVEFAVKHNLEHYRDEMNNVIIIKEAAEGLENAPAVIIQGHSDMVCEKTADCKKDMATDGLDLVVDGDYLYAEGTTLGGDDGIAVAYALALLSDDKSRYPRLEVVITVDEEIGLLGASFIDLSKLKGKWLLNIDSEEEGIFTAGCAGGLTAHCKFDVTTCENTKPTYKVTLEGLVGGHSGVEINKYRANANKLIGRILASVDGLGLVSISGGKKDNVIPSRAEALVACDEIDVTEVESILKNEYKNTDPELKIKVEKVETSSIVLDDESTKKVLNLLCTMPNGIRNMYPESGLVKTSLNMGILNADKDGVEIGYSVRSSVDSEKYALVDELKKFAEINGGELEISGDYCGWDFKDDSSLRDIMCNVFRRQYGKDPVIDVIHAGLECGMLSSKIEGLDCVSFGPNMLDIHTPKEKLSISSAKRVWEFIKEVLREIGE